MSPPGKGELLGKLLRDRTLTWCFAALALLCLGANLLGYGIFGCPFKAATRLPCPGCGLTRSCSAFIRGDFAASFKWHPFGPVIVVIGLAALLGSFASQPRREIWAGKIGGWERHLRVVPLFFALFFGYGILRMIG